MIAEEEKIKEERIKRTQMKIEKDQIEDKWQVIWWNF